jgi:preprotein translocase subunit YajC
VNYWPYLVMLVVLGGLLMFSVRNRRRQLAEEMVRISQISFGDEVMTTSGLYGTVVGRNDDGTVQLAIAPGVEVKWALAALRDARSLPEQYRKPIHDDHMDGDADRDADADRDRGVEGDADTDPPDAGRAP